jgi:tRNA threonylcarbamoyladenosine biosynthesis protein TsaE
MKVCTVSKEETQALARQLLSELRPAGQSPLGGATVVGLRGDLGAGKTTLAQGIARKLGVTEHVTSPTFILERIYKLSGPTAQLGRWERLVHIDAYRLDDEKELKHLGWQELLADPGNLVLVEWPERVGAAMPADTLYIDCKHIDELRREISWDL